MEAKIEEEEAFKNFCVEFLIQNKCYKTFMHNLKMHKKDSFDYYIVKLVKLNRLRDFIMLAFTWSNTRQHGDYWSTVHSKWEEYLKSFDKYLEEHLSKNLWE